MRFAIDDPAVEAAASTMLRETIERSGWYPDLKPQDREVRIEQDVELMWRMMAKAARERLEQGRVRLVTKTQGRQEFDSL